MKYDLYMQSPSIVTLVVYNTRLANKINTHLKYYDTLIKEGEEPIFNMSLKKWDTLRASIRTLKTAIPLEACPV